MTKSNTAKIDVRYEDHDSGGGSVWVLMQPRQYFIPDARFYFPEYVCVASTLLGKIDSRVLQSNKAFLDRTKPAASINDPYSEVKNAD